MAEELKIGFIGAGGVNFGGAEGPWDHASRLEKIGGLRLAGVADPDVVRAQRALARRRGPMYEGARVFADYQEMLKTVRLDAVWIGVPPHAHGASGERGIELRCLEAGVHMFVEKPLSARPPAEVRKVADALAASPLVVSVGYMFRYSRAVARMRQLLDVTHQRARVVAARYRCAYSEIHKPGWWDLRYGGGPIVEQATHFVDLARYLGGEVNLTSVRALTIPEDTPFAQLAGVPAMPDGRRPRETVPVPYRSPSATAAIWQFQSGAVGSLTHSALLHRKKYDCELEVIGDGLRLELQDPYGACQLLVRMPGQDKSSIEPFGEDDSYLTEDTVFVEAVRRRDASAVRSTYADAFRTHELTWAVRSQTCSV